MLVDPAPLATTPIRVTTPALSVLIQNMECLLAPITDLCQILYKVVTPYILEAWRQALHDMGISQNYPNLMHDLEFGSPTGNPPSLDFTFIPKDLTSTEINHVYITNLIAEEVTLGCMDGLYSIEEVHLIYGSHFHTCLLGLMEKPGLVNLQMICHFSKEDQFILSRNRWLDSDEFLTRWFTACQTAEFMSYYAVIVYFPSAYIF